jgi:hypothetical protein
MRVALGLIMLAADRAFFPTLLIPDLRNVAAAVWVLAYLWLSVRVDRVFCKQNWA